MTTPYPHNRRSPLSALAHSHEDVDQTPYHEDVDEAAPEAPLKVLVVDRRGQFVSDIERAARALDEAPKIVLLDHPTRLLEAAYAEAPDVVLAAPEEMTTTGLRRLAQVHRAFPKTVITLTQGDSPISATEAAACGASDVVPYPASTVKLRNALNRILGTAGLVRGERVVIREVPAPAPLPAPAAAAPPEVGTARVYTVTSPTGGCGKTFFATNVAAYLAHATGGRVLLVDLDLQFGEVSLALGLRPQRTISELIAEENILEAFPDYTVDHSSGYKVLSAPADPFAAELVGPREATQVLEAARTLFDYVVVDTPPSLNEVVLAAFDQSRYLAVMATLDVPSLRNLRVFLETIERLKLPAEDVFCVLNKAEPDNGIDLQELLKVYPRGFAAVLPYAKEVSRSLNVGQPVMMVDPKAEISQRLLEAGSKLVPAAEITNPAWGARPASRGGWGGRRKDRHATPQPAPAAPARPAPIPQPAPVPVHATPAAPVAPHYEPATWPAHQPAAQARPQDPYAQTPGNPWEVPGAAAAPVPQGWAGPPPARPAGPAYQGGAPARRSFFGRMFHRTGRHSAVEHAGPDAGPGPVWPAPLPAAEQMWVGPQSPIDTPAPTGVYAEAPTMATTGGGPEAAPERGEGRRQRPTEAPKRRGKESKR